MSKVLIVFDFDWSFVDQDTDRWIFELLSPKLRKRLEDLESTSQWTDLMADSLKRLHAEGKTREEIENALKSIPFHPAMHRAMRKLQSSSSPPTLLCLSNANSVFINTILNHHGLETLFKDIITNPAIWQGELLKVERKIKPDEEKQHECKIGCSANMCKGDELTAYIESRGGFEEHKTIIYIGDGSNDYCPILRLREQDLAFVRNGRGLEKAISNRGNVLARISKWDGAWEVERGLLGEVLGVEP